MFFEIFEIFLFEIQNRLTKNQLFHEIFKLNLTKET